MADSAWPTLLNRDSDELEAALEIFRELEERLGKKCREEVES